MGAHSGNALAGDQVGRVLSRRPIVFKYRSDVIIPRPRCLAGPGLSRTMDLKAFCFTLRSWSWPHLKIAGRILLAATLAVLTGACGLRFRADPLEGTVWDVRSFDSVAPLNGTVITISFQDGIIVANAGCNRIGAKYSVQGQQIELGGLESTEEGCVDPPGVLDQEQSFMRALMRVERIEIDGKSLMLFGGEEMSIVATRIS